MRKLDFKNLYGLNFSIRFEMVQKAYRAHNEVVRQSIPLTHTALIYLHKCNARYNLPDGTVMIAREGDVVLIPSDSCYDMVFFGTEPKDGYSITILLDLLDYDGEALQINGQPFVAAQGNGECADLFDQIKDNNTAFPSALSLVYADLYQLFHLFTTEYEKNVYSVGQFSSIAKAIDRLRCDDAFTMSVAQLAAECNVSESYLRRQFKLYSGLSPVKYVRMRKIMAAKNLLRHSDLSLKEIADRLAFEDVSYFCRIFRQETDMTPSQYRKQHGP